MGTTRVRWEVSAEVPAHPCHGPLAQLEMPNGVPAQAPPRLAVLSSDRMGKRVSCLVAVPGTAA